MSISQFLSKICLSTDTHNVCPPYGDLVIDIGKPSKLKTWWYLEIVHIIFSAYTYFIEERREELSQRK